MIVIQTRALLVDAYRDLNARKMFWWVLGFTALTIALFASVGIRDNQLNVLGFDLPFDAMYVSALTAYKTGYTALVINFYMGFAATLLALISTAGIFPDLIASGSIDLYLSKPLGRVRLFLTKYVTGLLFVGLQITLVAVGSYLVMGMRAGFWAPGIFLSIPIVLSFFSYLYAIAVLLGVMTRSAMATLFLTLLAWLMISGMNNLEVYCETAFPMYEKRAHDAELALPRLDRQIETTQYRIQKARNAATQSAGTQRGGAGTQPAGWSAEEASLTSDLGRWQRQREQVQRQAAEKGPPEILLSAQSTLFYINTLLPKTGETLNLLNRIIISDEESQAVKVRDVTDERDQRRQRHEAERTEMQKFLRSRSPWWIICSSLGFEVVVVGLACWVFCRRDY